MIEFAEHEFALDRRLGDGASERDHIESAARQMERFGFKPKESIAEPDGELPEQVRYLWNWFREISLGRGATGFGPARISWQDLKAWSELTGNDPTPWEVEVIMRLDIAFMNAEAAKADKEAKENDRQNRTRHL